MGRRLSNSGRTRSLGVASTIQSGPPQPRRDKGLAVAAADPFVVSATILQPLQRVSGHANRAGVAALTEHQPVELPRLSFAKTSSHSVDDGRCSLATGQGTFRRL